MDFFVPGDSYLGDMLITLTARPSNAMTPLEKFLNTNDRR